MGEFSEDPSALAERQAMSRCRFNPSAHPNEKDGVDFFSPKTTKKFSLKRYKRKKKRICHSITEHNVLKNNNTKKLTFIDLKEKIPSDYCFRYC